MLEFVLFCSRILLNWFDFLFFSLVGCSWLFWFDLSLFKFAWIVLLPNIIIFGRPPSSLIDGVFLVLLTGLMSVWICFWRFRDWRVLTLKERIMLGANTQKNLRKYIGVIKDSTSVGLVKVNSDYKVWFECYLFFYLFWMLLLLLILVFYFRIWILQWWRRQVILKYCLKKNTLEVSLKILNLLEMFCHSALQHFLGLINKVLKKEVTLRQSECYEVGSTD